MNNATSLEGSSVILEEQNIEQDGETLIQNLLTMVDFNNDEDQASKLKEVEWNDDGDGGYKIIQKWKMIPQIHLSNLVQNKSKQNQTKRLELLLLKKMMIVVKGASLTTVISLKHHQSNHKVTLYYYSSLDHLY
jgi:hypothetical protein